MQWKNSMDLVILEEWSNNNLPIQSLLMQDQGTDIQKIKTLAPTTNSKYTVYEILLWVFQKIFFFFWTLYFWRMAPAIFLSIFMCWGGLETCSLMSSTEFRKFKSQDLPTVISAARWTLCGTETSWETRKEIDVFLHHNKSCHEQWWIFLYYSASFKPCSPIHSPLFMNQAFLLLLPLTAWVSIDGRTSPANSAPSWLSAVLLSVRPLVAAKHRGQKYHRLDNSRVKPILLLIKAAW